VTQGVFSITDRSTGFRLTINATQALDQFERAPRLTYKHLRRYFNFVLIIHRQHWLSLKSNAFGRGRGGQGDAINVSNVASWRQSVKPNQVLYDVQPSAKTAKSAIEAENLIGQIAADIYTGNVILPIHEEGRDITSASPMAIPVKTRPGSPKAWRARNPGKSLRYKTARDGTGLLFEVTNLKPRLARAPKGFVGPRALVTEKWRLRFILKRRVDMKPTLKFYKAWDDTAADRDRAWVERVNKLERDINYSAPSEL
jgi:hypothetical protein